MYYTDFLDLGKLGYFELNYWFKVLSPKVVSFPCKCNIFEWVKDKQGHVVTYKNYMYIDISSINKEDDVIINFIDKDKNKEVFDEIEDYLSTPLRLVNDDRKRFIDFLENIQVPSKNISYNEILSYDETLMLYYPNTILEDWGFDTLIIKDVENNLTVSGYDSKYSVLPIIKISKNQKYDLTLVGIDGIMYQRDNITLKEINELIRNTYPIQI